MLGIVLRSILLHEHGTWWPSIYMIMIVIDYAWIIHGLWLCMTIMIYCRVQSYEFFRATAWRFNNRLFKYHYLSCFCQLFINPHNPPCSNVSIMVLNHGFQFPWNLPCFYHVFINFLEKPAVFPLCSIQNWWRLAGFLGFTIFAAEIFDFARKSIKMISTLKKKKHWHIPMKLI